MLLNLMAIKKQTKAEATFSMKVKLTNTDKHDSCNVLTVSKLPPPKNWQLTLFS